ncbi:ribbon-helix-helix domain-containing protein [Halobacteriaceae archaeon GCM10025711]
MSKIELSLPDRIHTEIDRLVEQGEFLNREQAVEELLSMGVSAYDVDEEAAPPQGENLFSQTVNDQQDPALQNDQQDDNHPF